MKRGGWAPQSIARFSKLGPLVVGPTFARLSGMNIPCKQKRFTPKMRSLRWTAQPGQSTVAKARSTFSSCAAGRQVHQLAEA